MQCEKCHTPKGKDTIFKIANFKRCTDCHKDEHNSQFAAKPYENQCDQCHNLKGLQSVDLHAGAA